MNKKEKIIIAGFSKLSNLIYNQLKQSHRYRLRVIDRKQIEDIDKSRFTKGQISSGDVLIKAGVKHSEYILVLTPDEDVNLMTALVASNLNSEIKIFVLINNIILSKRIQSMYNNIIPISPQNFIAPFLFSLSYKNHNIGFFKYEYSMYNILAKNNKILVEKSNEVLTSKKSKKFNFLKKLIAYFKYYKIISKEDKLLNYTLGFVFIFIVLMTIFAFFNNITNTIIDGFYFAVTMITTIGFGDINFLDTTQFAKFFGSLGMILGVLLMTILNAAIINVLVARTLKKSDILLDIPEGDHTIICGIGNTGKEYISMYKKYKNKDTLVGIDKINLQEHIINDLGIPIISGDAEIEDNLNKLFIEKANSLIVTTESDITNVNISLLARYKNKNINIITRINNSSIARHLNPSDSKSRVIDVSKILSEIIMANIMFKNSVIGITMEENRYILVMKIPISYFSSISDISFVELEEDYQLEPIYEIMNVKKYDKLNTKEELILRTTIEQLLAIKSQMIEKFRCQFEFKNSKENIEKVEKALDYLNLYSIIGNISSQNVLIINISHGVASCLKAYLKETNVSYEFKYLKTKKLYGKILLCENEVASKKNLLNFFNSLGYQADCVEDVESLNKSLDTKIYDILILNVMLSGIIPAELIKSIREKEKDSNKQLFIIGINDSTSNYENKIFLEIGINNVLERPFENKQLEIILDNYIKNKKFNKNSNNKDKYDLSEVFDSIDNNFSLFLELFNSFNKSYMAKLENIVNYASAGNRSVLISELKKFKSAISIFRIDEFIDELNDLLELALDNKYDEIKVRVVELSFKIQDFILFIKLNFK